MTESIHRMMFYRLLFKDKDYKISHRSIREKDKSISLYSLFEAHEFVWVTSIRDYGDVDALAGDEHVCYDPFYESDYLQPILVPDWTGSVKNEGNVRLSSASWNTDTNNVKINLSVHGETQDKINLCGGRLNRNAGNTTDWI